MHFGPRERRRIAQQMQYFKDLARQAPAAIEANRKDESTIRKLREEKSECEKAVFEPANQDYGR